LDFFNDHSKGRSKRSKIRKRNYADTNTCFLEIKKSINGKTFKTRVQSHFSPTFSTNDIEFLQLNDFDVRFFQPVLLIEYNRFVLWDKHLEGRITIDLLFKPSSEKKEKLFDNIYIFEIKGNRHFINRTIRKINFPISRHQTSFSKYCIGMIQINNLSRQKSRDLFGIYNQLVKTNNSV
jgi:hypothetical protein